MNNMNIEITTLKKAEEITGGVAKTSKLDTCSSNLSAFDCDTGSELAKIPGSVCFDCYARKGNYRFSNVKKALQRRTKLISDDSWVKAWVFILKNKKRITNSGLFRHHDSGDIQDMAHFKKIVQVAKQTPEIRHWLPTKESSIIKNFKGEIPENLVIRLSGSMVDGKPPKYKHTSTVTTDPDKATCRAFETQGKCSGCTKCWDARINNIVYLKH